MKPAAPDFLLMWDNAYCIHEFDGDFVPFADILSLCEQYGNADMVYEFASTSKITLPGAGVAELSHDPVTALALCAEALKWGLGDFFGESASSLLGALFAPSSPRRP